MLICERLLPWRKALREQIDCIEYAMGIDITQWSFWQFQFVKEMITTNISSSVLVTEIALIIIVFPHDRIAILASLSPTPPCFTREQWLMFYQACALHFSSAPKSQQGVPRHMTTPGVLSTSAIAPWNTRSSLGRERPLRWSFKKKNTKTGEILMTASLLALEFLRQRRKVCSWEQDGISWRRQDLRG